VRRPRRQRAVARLLGAAALACLSLPTAPAHAAHDIRLLSNSLGAERTVVATVEVHSFPGDRCGAVVDKAGRRRDLPGVTLGSTGGAQWTWEPARGVRAGRWSVRVTCRSRRHVARAQTSFLAPSGTGPGSPRALFAISHVLVTELDDLGGGSGGGTQHAVYPKGQCTWWVKQQRPDLPYFAGRDGDAMNWADAATNAHYPVGAQPVPGAIAVWRSEQYNVGRYGHVAFVLGVYDDQIEVSDMNYGGSRKPRIHRVAWADLRFIYGGPAGDGPPSDDHHDQPPPLPVPLTVAVTEPTDSSIVAGTARLAASSNAPAVRFDVFYYTDPSTKASGVTKHLLDTTPDDGFTADLDTRSIPNQGGPAGTSVTVTAIALQADGSPSGAQSTIRVNVANAKDLNGHRAYPYYVVSACEASASCLSLRTGPGVTGNTAVATKRDGEEVDIVCQAHGEPVDNPDGTKTDIWDRLADGTWAFDYYVDTPNRGTVSPPIALCPAPVRTGVVQYDCPNQPGVVAKNLNPGQYWRNDFVAMGDQVTGGSMSLSAANDGAAHRATVGIFRDSAATDPVGSTTVTIPPGGTASAFTFATPLSVTRGATLYFAVRAIDSVTAYDQPGADGCVIGHLDGTTLTYPAPS
jgi:hypothetical protein